MRHQVLDKRQITENVRLGLMIPTTDIAARAGVSGDVVTYWLRKNGHDVAKYSADSRTFCVVSEKSAKAFLRGYKKPKRAGDSVGGDALQEALKLAREKLRSGELQFGGYVELRKTMGLTSVIARSVEAIFLEERERKDGRG